MPTVCQPAELANARNRVRCSNEVTRVRSFRVGTATVYTWP